MSPFLCLLSEFLLIVFYQVSLAHLISDKVLSNNTRS